MGRRIYRVVVAGAVLAAGMAPVAAQVTIGPGALTGRWSEPFEEGGAAIPLCLRERDRFVCKPVAQAMSVLPDGRILYFDGLGERGSVGPSTEPGPELRSGPGRILDLRTGTPNWTVPAAGRGRLAGDQAGDNLLGADVATLADGRLLLAGGAAWSPGPGPPNGDSLSTTRVFDPIANRFAPAAPMRFGRWFPATVTLPDGRVMVAGGAAKPARTVTVGNVRQSEIFDPSGNTWSDATQRRGRLGAETSLPLSPHLYLMPNGKVFYAAAGENAAASGATADEALYPLQQFFDPADGTWSAVGPGLFGMRDGAGTVLLPLDPPYDRATVLTFGGTVGPSPAGVAGTSLVTATSVDRIGRVRERRTRWEMLAGRWSPSSVVLPDGSVLVMGGASNSETTAPGTGLPTRTAELFDPGTEQWSAMARTSRDRTYGHSAVLLPDGRVLFGGHSPPVGPVAPGAEFGESLPDHGRDPSFEIFTPPYLFRGPRPTIRHAPAGIAWGTTFELDTHQALSIQSVVLARLPSPGHSIDSDARTVRLAFTRRSGGLRVTAPPDGVTAPPGFYYVFINRETAQGPVPSMARIVRLGAATDPAEAVQPFADRG